jgi:hypothetical protein
VNGRIAQREFSAGVNELDPQIELSSRTESRLGIGSFFSVHHWRGRRTYTRVVRRPGSRAPLSGVNALSLKNDLSHLADGWRKSLSNISNNWFGVRLVTLSAD